MHYFRLFFFCLFIFSLSSCEKLSNSYADLKRTTGLDLFDANGNAIGRWNVPNDNRGPNLVFPVPSNGIVNVFSSESVSEFWVLNSVCEANDNDDILDLTQEVVYDLEDLRREAIFSSPLDNIPNLQIDLTVFDPGFYRIFMTDESGRLYWQNIYIDPSATDFPTFDFLDEACS